MASAKAAASPAAGRGLGTSALMLAALAQKGVTAALNTLHKVLDDWYPGSAQLAQAQHWKGARPMLPDGPPVLGASGAPGSPTALPCAFSSTSVLHSAATGACSSLARSRSCRASSA